MWCIAEYEATALFSLKPATATSSGGRTLLVPTPFAIKMALLDVLCRVEGVNKVQDVWPWLGTARVALHPAKQVVVNNVFTKVLKPRRNPAQPGTQNAGFFQQTIAYREYAYLHGPFSIALEVESREQAQQLAGWLLCLNYLGKRGSFIQITGMPQLVETLPADAGFIVVGESLDSLPLESILTQLDDVGEKVTFEQVSIYSGKRITLGKHRVLHHVVLPYQLVASSRAYSYYQTTE